MTRLAQDVRALQAGHPFAGRVDEGPAHVHVGDRDGEGDGVEHRLVPEGPILGILLHPVVLGDVLDHLDVADIAPVPVVKVGRVHLEVPVHAGLSKIGSRVAGLEHGDPAPVRPADVRVPVAAGLAQNFVPLEPGYRLGSLVNKGPAHLRIGDRQRKGQGVQNGLIEVDLIGHPEDNGVDPGQQILGTPLNPVGVDPGVMVSRLNGSLEGLDFVENAVMDMMSPKRKRKSHNLDPPFGSK